MSQLFRVQTIFSLCVLAGLSMSITACTGPAMHSNSTSEERKAVEEAIIRYNTPADVPLRIVVESVSGGYARGKVGALDRQGETETVYLKKNGTQWEVLDQGTGANPHDDGIPDDVIEKLDQ